MAQLMVVRAASQSSLFLLQSKTQFLFDTKPFAKTAHLPTHLSTRLDHLRLRVVSSDSKATPTIDFAGSVKEGLDIQLDSGSGDIGGTGGFGDKGRGGGGGGDEGGENEESGGDEEGGSKKDGKMSMSQKITLGYAALVGLGGLMGFLKSGSQKSLLSGGLSAALLYYVYTQLPTRPVLASSLGLGLAASLLVVMGSRFKKSKKIFPAGVVSLVSLIMTGGYVHGILRSAH